MISFRKDGVHFGLRTVAVIIDNGRVLVHQIEGRDYHALPGGRVEMHEDSKQALVREMQEELELDVQVGKLLWVVENFFEEDCALYRGVEFYYLVTLPEDAPLRTTTEPVYTEDTGVGLMFRWFPFDELDNITLYPEFLKTGLRDLPEIAQHIVVHQ